MREHVTVGVFGKARGLAGDVRLRSVTDFPDRYFRPGPFLLRDGDELRPVRLLHARHLKDETWVARLEGCGVAEAERLAGRELLVPAAKRVRPPRGTFYIEDVIGMPVTDDGGAPLGEVVGAERFPAGDCLLVRLPGGGETLLLFSRALLTVDRAKGAVRLRDPAALSPVNADAEEGA